jgi:hypothetical protein
LPDASQRFVIANDVFEIVALPDGCAGVPRNPPMPLVTADLKPATLVWNVAATGWSPLRRHRNYINAVNVIGHYQKHPVRFPFGSGLISAVHLAQSVRNDLIAFPRQQYLQTNTCDLA